MASSTLTYLDAYCERAGDAGLWAEPLNAITNIGFLIAAYMCVRLMRSLQPLSLRSHGDLWILIVALAAIGIGSGLWHTHAAHWSMLADVIPITIFMNVYLLAALWRLFQFSWPRVVFFWLLYQAITVAAQVYLPPDLLHGTVMYLPTYLALLLLTVGLYRKHPAHGKVFELVLIVWTASLVFRTADMEFCQILPIGTHFLWHILNSYVLYRLFEVLVNSAKKPSVAS